MRRSVLRILLIVFIVLVTVGCDQLTKHIARSSLKNQDTVKLLGNVFVLTYAENQGAFLSLGSNWPDYLRRILFGILPLAAIICASIYIVIMRRLNLLQTSALSLIIGGGAGNLIDRLIYDGLVADFMNLGVGRLRTGIFNFADVFLISGAALFILSQRWRNNNLLRRQ